MRVLHGHARDSGRSPTYNSWYYMRRRCLRACKEYRHYGGRGISICQRWLDSFDAFLADMGERPPGKTLDRINNDGNYEPGNCRWATIIEQNQNSRSTRFIEHAGKRLPLSEWERLMGFKHGTLRHRLESGWSVDRAITTPCRATKVSASESCALHGDKSWSECWQCGGEGVYGHDCGEDCCVCLDPEDNERCDICSGKGGWIRCYTCAPEET